MSVMQGNCYTVAPQAPAGGPGLAGPAGRPRYLSHALGCLHRYLQYAPHYTLYAN